MNGLVYSSAQASKMSRDLMHDMEDRMMSADLSSTDLPVKETIHKYSEKYKYMQIAGILEDQLNDFTVVNKLQDDDWFDMESGLFNVKEKMENSLPDFDQQIQLSNEELAYTAEACNSEIAYQYEQIKELYMDAQL